jgi:hypothetical protein
VVRPTLSRGEIVGDILHVCLMEVENREWEMDVWRLLRECLGLWLMVDK